MMFADMPPVPPTVMQCLVSAERDYKVPRQVLTGIMDVEGGKPGIKRMNKNGTTDVGRMQINTVWQEYFKTRYEIPPADLQWNDCISIRSAAYIVRREWGRTNDFWKAVGNYHSRTPRLNRAYVNKVQIAIIKRVSG